jgi:hypothetical protein
MVEQSDLIKNGQLNFIVEIGYWKIPWILHTNIWFSKKRILRLNYLLTSKQYVKLGMHKNNLDS